MVFIKQIYIRGDIKMKILLEIQTVDNEGTSFYVYYYVYGYRNALCFADRVKSLGLGTVRFASA